MGITLVLGSIHTQLTLRTMLHDDEPVDLDDELLDEDLDEEEDLDDEAPIGTEDEEEETF